ncbi:Hypothetical protein A7982_08459 [Minicystis rosea]|nr:Hypothetical protein A7982_08459 [Minicystis rosea]
MSGFSRRSFLKGALAGGAIAGASAVVPRIAGASGLTTATLSNGRTYKILEIFLDGGADFWAHAYQVPTWVGNATQYNPGLSTISTGSPNDWSPLFTGVSDPTLCPPTPLHRTFFAFAPNGDRVYWGPGVTPLVPHAGRARMVILRHSFPFHEGAGPLALTGNALGRAGAFSLGAAVNRTRAPGEAPVSFVIAVGEGHGTNTLSSATAIGAHGTENAPVLVAMGNTALAAQLARDVPPAGSTVARSDGDALRRHYNNRYRSMLYHAGSRTRSRAYDAYEGALGTLQQHQGVQARINGVSFAVPPTTNAAQNATVGAIEAAAGLLANGARHVLVADAGWDTHTGSYYSTFEGYAAYLTKRTYQVAYGIHKVIASGAIDLDDTLVFIHSEFGRHQSSPNSNGVVGNGTEHNPEGYPVLLLGGPITTRGIAGILTGPANPFGIAVGDGVYGVTAVRAAVSLAAGIDPWQADMYSQSEDWFGLYLSQFTTLSAGNVPVLEQGIFGL